MRAVLLGMRVLKSDESLQAAIRYQLTAHRRTQTRTGPSAGSVIASLATKQRKLLDLYYGEQIDAETFDAENRRLTTLMKTLQSEAMEIDREQREREEAVERFDQVAELLAGMDVDRIWKEATLVERRALVEDLIDSVRVYPDRILVEVAGAPPFTIALDEVGLTQGCKPVVSEAGLEPARP